MMIGLDRAFKPEWVYKMLKISKPGTKYKDLEPEFNSIIEIDGLKSKKNIMTIIRRYYLKIYRKDGSEYLDENYLHNLAVKYSFDTLSPLLLFALINNCEIAKFLQEKINLKFLHNGSVDRKSLLESAQAKYGDRRVIKYAVGYYITILQYFNVLDPKSKNYDWLNKKFEIPNYLLKEIILLYGSYNNMYELDTQEINNEISLTYIDLSDIENVFREYNSEYWKYQKRLNKNMIILNKFVKV
jgi:hypothetical protein